MPTKCHIEMPENMALTKYSGFMNLLSFLNPSRGFKNGQKIVNNEPFLFAEFLSDTDKITTISDLIAMINDGAYITGFPFFYSIPENQVNSAIPESLPRSIETIYEIDSETGEPIPDVPPTYKNLTWLEWNSLGSNTWVIKDGFYYFNSNPFNITLDSVSMEIIYDLDYSEVLTVQEYQAKLS